MFCYCSKCFTIAVLCLLSKKWVINGKNRESTIYFWLYWKQKPPTFTKCHNDYGENTDLNIGFCWTKKFQDRKEDIVEKRPSHLTTSRSDSDVESD